MNTFSKQLLTLFLISFLFVFTIPTEVPAEESLQCQFSQIEMAGGLEMGVIGTEISKNSLPACTSVDTGALGFQIPTLGDILTFAIRAFFVIAGIAALFYMLIGAFAWVTSGGDKDAVGAARDKIQAAVVGMILIVAVLAIIWTLEQVVFKRRICMGLSCPLTLPGLIETTGEGANCCVCIKDDGSMGDRIDTFTQSCGPDGEGM